MEMKKKLLFLTCIAVFALSLSACNNNLKTIVEDGNQQEKETVKNQEEKTLKSEEIEMGASYTIPDLCTFTVNFVELKKELLPPNKDGVYTYYPEEDGKTYVDVSVSVENLRETGRAVDDFGTMKVICDGKYEYDSQSTLESSNGSSFTPASISEIDPLTVETIHYFASIPNKVAEDESMTISIELTMLGNNYTLSVR
jgi:hypothetical protein